MAFQYKDRIILNNGGQSTIYYTEICSCFVITKICPELKYASNIAPGIESLQPLTCNLSNMEERLINFRLLYIYTNVITKCKSSLFVKLGSRVKREKDMELK